MTELLEAADGAPHRGGRADVAGAVEDVRIAEGQLERRRTMRCGPSATTREALRLVAAAADAGTPLTPSDLALELRLKTPSVSSILTKLTKHGLVSTMASESDGRRKHIIPSDRHLDVDALDPLNGAIRALVAELSDDETAVVADFLSSLRMLIDSECR